jgi:ribosomal protein S18 acetylase RimI-like enzyme
MTKYSQYYKVALVEGNPCGYVGVIENDIRVCIDPLYQGKGIGKFMISEIKKIWPDALAKVKVDNEASLKLFRACGYEIQFYLMSCK